MIVSALNYLWNSKVVLRGAWLWGGFALLGGISLCMVSFVCVCVCVFGGGGVRRGVGLRALLGFGVFGAGSGFRVGWRNSGCLLSVFRGFFVLAGVGAGLGLVLWFCGSSGTFLVFPNFLRS